MSALSLVSQIWQPKSGKSTCAQRRAAPDGPQFLLDAIQRKKLTLFALKGRPTRACA
jgi:hypothetical protein